MQASRFAETGRLSRLYGVRNRVSFEKGTNQTVTASDMPAVLLAAHGETGGAQNNALLARVAAEVAAQLPDLPVACGVLNGAPALEEALVALAGRHLLVHPFFMSNGYFVRQALPKRLEESPVAGWTLLTPLGLLPSLPALIAKEIITDRQEILIVSHGATKSDRSRLATEAFSGALRRALPGREITCCYLEEEPFAEQAVAKLGPHAQIVSFFAGEGAHGRSDLTRLVADSGKPDLAVTDSVGALPGLADLIVAELREAEAKATRARNITETCFIHSFSMLLYCSRRTVGLLPTVDSIWGTLC